MRIVHFSDWHGERHQLPEADLYICTGDMYDNYPIYDKVSWFKITQERESVKQYEEAAKLVREGGFKQHLGSPEAPVVCVRGNHDFYNLAPLFEGCNVAHEFVDNELIEVAGLKITGHRGIPYIYGTWSDEERRSELKDRLRAMPSADVYLTHYPPAGVLDAGYGLEGMADNLMYRGTKFLHCFGHIHEEGGQTRRLATGLFSNAACNVNVIDWNP